MDPATSPSPAATSDSSAHNTSSRAAENDGNENGGNGEDAVANDCTSSVHY